MAANDAVAAGVIDALADAGSKALVVGINGTNKAVDAIKAGKLMATGDYNAVEQGCIGVTIAVRSLRQEPVPTKAWCLPPCSSTRAASPMTTPQPPTALALPWRTSRRGDASDRRSAFSHAMQRAVKRLSMDLALTDGQSHGGDHRMIATTSRTPVAVAVRSRLHLFKGWLGDLDHPPRQEFVLQDQFLEERKGLCWCTKLVYRWGTRGLERSYAERYSAPRKARRAVPGDRQSAGAATAHRRQVSPETAASHGQPCGRQQGQMEVRDGLPGATAGR